MRSDGAEHPSLLFVIFGHVSWSHTHKQLPGWPFRAAPSRFVSRPDVGSALQLLIGQLATEVHVELRETKPFRSLLAVQSAKLQLLATSVGRISSNDSSCADSSRPLGPISHTNWPVSWQNRRLCAGALLPRLFLPCCAAT